MNNKDDTILGCVVLGGFVIMSGILYFGLMYLKFGTLNPAYWIDITSYKKIALYVSIFAPPLIAAAVVLIRDYHNQKALHKYRVDIKDKISDHNTIYDRMNEILSKLDD